MAKSNAPRNHVKAAKAKSKMSKTGALTKELMNKAVRHIAEEIVAAKPGLDGRTPRGFAEKLVNEGKETFPTIVSMTSCSKVTTSVGDSISDNNLSIGVATVNDFVGCLPCFWV